MPSPVAAQTQWEPNHGPPESHPARTSRDESQHGFLILMAAKPAESVATTTEPAVLRVATCPRRKAPLFATNQQMQIHKIALALGLASLSSWVVLAVSPAPAPTTTPAPTASQGCDCIAQVAARPVNGCVCSWSVMWFLVTDGDCTPVADCVPNNACEALPSISIGAPCAADTSSPMGPLIRNCGEGPIGYAMPCPNSPMNAAILAVLLCDPCS